MANTVTQRTIVGGGSEKVIVRVINIVSDGTQETSTVIYDNSAFVNNVTKGRLMSVEISGNNPDAVVTLKWDQTVDSVVVSTSPGAGQGRQNFRKFGGIKNPNGAGATGDLLLDTLGLVAGNNLTVIIWITQN